jgi:hypothetical protein
MLIALLLCAAVPDGTLVTELVPADAKDRAFAAVVGDQLTAALAARKGAGRVVGAAELKGLLDAQAQQQLVGCDDARCYADVATAVAVERVVVGRAGVVGGQGFVAASLVDARDAAVLARASVAVDVKQPRPARAQLAALLLDPQPQGADDKLASLRVAVAFDEVDEAGKPSLLRPLESCVTQQLLDSGASLASAAAVARLKGLAAPRDLLAGRLPDGLSADEVDVVLAGAAQSAVVGGFAGTSKLEVQLATQLVQVDTGDVVGTANASASAVDHAVAPALRQANQKLCAKVVPALTAALEKRVARGSRVVVDVDGVSSLQQAEQIVQRLDGLRRVGRARLARFSGSHAVVDVVVVGGDAVALALELPASLGLTVTTASSSALKARAAS